MTSQPFAFRLLIGAISFVVGALPVVALTNADIISMVDAGLSEETIIMSIRSGDPEGLDTSATALIELKKNDVGEPIIQAIIQRKQGSPPAPAAEATGRSRVVSNDVQDDVVLPPVIDPVPGNDYHVRYTFKFEKGERSATNYWRGELVPINTKVKLIAVRGERITFKLIDSGTVVVLENAPKFTTRSVETIAREMFSEAPTAIEKYGDDMARNIRSGTPRLGMTKTQVLLTRGYPPGHETPSLEADLWKYWSSRFVVHSFRFEGNILVEGRGLY